MSGVLIFLFLLSGLFVLLIVAGIFWSIRSGQFDDLEGPAERIVMDDDDPMLPARRLNKAVNSPNISLTQTEHTQ
jgi:cbb3-type cytochrome oxidase maturation protein